MPLYKGLRNDRRKHHNKLAGRGLRVRGDGQISNAEIEAAAKAVGMGKEIELDTTDQTSSISPENYLELPPSITTDRRL